MVGIEAGNPSEDFLAIGHDPELAANVVLPQGLANETNVGWIIFRKNNLTRRSPRSHGFLYSMPVYLYPLSHCEAEDGGHFPYGKAFRLSSISHVRERNFFCKHCYLRQWVLGHLWPSSVTCASASRTSGAGAHIGFHGPQIREPRTAEVVTFLEPWVRSRLDSTKLNLL